MNSDPSLCFSLPAVPLAALVSYVSALRLTCPPQIWNLVAGPQTGQGSYAAGRVDANVDAAAAVDRALGVCASVMMPAVSDTRASSVEVPRAFRGKGEEGEGRKRKRGRRGGGKGGGKRGRRERRKEGGVRGREKGFLGL